MYRAVAIVIAALTLTAPVAAGDGILGFRLFKKRQKPQEPAARSKQLIATLQNDADARKRRQAAEELRGLDPRNDGDIVTALIGSLQRDPDPKVRAAAAESIGKLKPVYQPAGIAMESSLATDPDQQVREAVKSSLWEYHLSGYRTPAAGNTYATQQTAEPPLAAARPQPSMAQPPVARAPRTAVPQPVDAGNDAPRNVTPQETPETGFRPITNTVGKGVFYQPTAEPPLAKPAPAPEPAGEAKAELPQPKPARTVPEPESKPTTPPPTTPNVPTVSVPLPTPTPVPSPVPSPSVPTPPSGVPTVGIPPLSTPPPGASNG